MYFLPKSNKFLAWVVMIKPLHLHVITLSAVALMISVWFFGVYAPLNKMVKQQRHQIVQSRDQYARMSAMNAQHGELVQSIGQATLAFDSYRSGTDYSNDLHNGMLYLMAQTDQLAITVNAFLANTYEDKDWYAKQELTLDMSGSYQKLINFLHLCTDSDYLFQVKNSSMTRISDGVFNLKITMDLVVIK